MQVLQEFHVSVTRKIPRPISKESARLVISAYSIWCIDTTPTEILSSLRMFPIIRSNIIRENCIWTKSILRSILEMHQERARHALAPQPRLRKIPRWQRPTQAGCGRLGGLQTMNPNSCECCLGASTAERSGSVSRSRVNVCRREK